MASIQSLIVRIGFWALGKATARASVLDRQVKDEVSAWPEGFTITLRVLPSGPAVSWQKVRGRLKFLGMKDQPEADLIVSIKSLKAATRMILAQMGIARAYAFRRIAIEGNTVDAMILTRILDKVEAYLFPVFLSKNILKQVPRFGLREYWNNLLIYLSLPF